MSKKRRKKRKSGILIKMIVLLVILAGAAFAVIEFVIPSTSVSLKEGTTDTILVEAKGIKKNISVDVKAIVDKLAPEDAAAITTVEVDGTDKNVTLNLKESYNINIDTKAMQTTIKGADEQVKIKALSVDGDLVLSGQNLIVSNGLSLTNGKCDVVKDTYLICAGQNNGIELWDSTFAINKGTVKAYSLDSYAVGLDDSSKFDLTAGKFTAVGGSNANKPVFGGDGSANVTVADGVTEYGDYKSTSKTLMLTSGYDLIFVFDPGHGDDEYGTTAGSENFAADSDEYLYYAEKTVNLKIAIAAKEELEKYSGVKVYLTRTDDSKLSLQGRADVANEKKADYFISMHNNSINDTKYRDSYKGAEVWQSVLPRYEDKGLCQAILNKIGELGLRTNRGVKAREDDGSTDNNKLYWDMLNNVTSQDNEPTDRFADYYGVIKASARYYIDGMIVEHMFLSNPDDMKYVETDSKTAALGIADAQAIAGYFNLK